MFFPGHNFVSGLHCTLKRLKTFKTLQTKKKTKKIVFSTTADRVAEGVQGEVSEGSPGEHRKMTLIRLEGRIFGCVL